MPDSNLDASIIVPTYREADNIRPLVERLFAALEQADICSELIIVDDNSQDGTDETVSELAKRYPVRLLVRKGERGLSGAVLRGFAEAQTETFVVMDADLQHPPESVPLLITKLRETACDFVIGTRYAAGGTLGSDWPLFRRLASRFATLLAAPLAPLSDPMSGFFALRRESWRLADPIDPIGYKIGLELFVKCGCRRAEEVPIDFATRHAGESKAGLGVLLRYLQHLTKLYRYSFPSLIPTLATFLCASLVALVWLLFRS